MNLCVVFCYISVVGVVSVMFIDGFLNKIYDYVFCFFWLDILITLSREYNLSAFDQCRNELILY